MFTCSNYRNDNLPVLKMQFDVFFNVIHERLIKFETFLHVCLVRRVVFIYAYLLSNEFALNWVNFYFIKCKVSIFVQYNIALYTHM